jgi:TolB-like protein
MRNGILAVSLAVGLSLPVTGQDNRPGIMVLPFVNGGSYGADAEIFDALQVGMQQMLMTELAQNPNARVVDRAIIRNILEEQDLAGSGRVDAETAARIGRLVGARYVVAGGFIDFYGDMRIDARITVVETSEIISTAKVEDKRSELYRLVVDLAGRVMQDAQLPPLTGQVRQAREQREIPTEAVTLYSRALYYEEHGRRDRAIELLSRVETQWPEMTEARETLRQLRQP